MSNHFTALNSKGFTNAATEDLGTLASGTPRIYRAFCYSSACAPTTTTTGAVKPRAKADMVFCPDCGHALHWSRVQENAQRNTRKRRTPGSIPS